MALDRRLLRRTPGLAFWKLLGTGSGRTFSLRDADPTTWGLFAVWENDSARRDFVERSSYARVWSDLAEEQWMAHLRLVRSKGTWSGRSPFEDGASAVEGTELCADGRLAVITRARVRPTQWRSFAKAVPPVAAAVNSTPGLQFTVGIGEAPIGLQATFSLWESAGAMQAFVYGHDAHRDVIRRTTTQGWYAEELFARFNVVSSAGTINGRVV